MRISLLVLLLAFSQSLAAQGTETDPEELRPKVEEVVVVTASRTEQFVHDAPASVSVITAEEIEKIPADDYGDILRNVAGLNVTQLSARDVQIAGRTPAGTLGTSQLVLLDGRSIYLDFFGFVMWDFLPVNVNEIKQIEVVRGPGSAVWGANALTGVIHLITKRPREMTGTSVTVGAGEIGSILGSVTHAGALDRLSYKLSASYYEQGPFRRPTGVVAGTTTRYPVFENEGTVQPKADLRIDYDLREGSYTSFPPATRERTVLFIPASVRST